MPAFASLVSCSDRLVLEAPPGVAHWALFTLDSEEELSASTPLGPVERALQLEVPLGHRAYLITHGPTLLDTLGVAALPETPVALATGCELPLPDPEAAFALRDDQLVSIPTQELPALTVPGLAAAGNAPEEDEVLVDVQCAIDHCDTVVERADCSIVVDGSACSLGQFSLILAQDRSYVAQSHCEIAPPVAGALAGLVCERPNFSDPCPVQLFRAAPFPEVELERVQVVDFPLREASSNRFAPFIVRDGHLHDLLILDDRVFVTSMEWRDAGLIRCRDRNRPQTLHIYDRDTLSPIAERESPRCLLAPIAISREQFLAFTTDAASSSLLTHRVDSNGLVVRTGTASFPDFEYAVVRGSLRLGPDQNVVLLFSPSIPMGAVIMVTDEGAPVWSQVFEGFEPSGLAPFPGGFLVSDSWEDGMWIFEPGGSRLGLPLVAGFYSRELGEPFRHGVSGRVLTPMPRDQRQITILRPDGLFDQRRLVSYERAGTPTALGDWGPDPQRSIAALSDASSEPPQVFLARVDPSAGHYLPGVIDIGLGAAALIRTDPEGRVYVLLSWAGQLVRLTPL